MIYHVALIVLPLWGGLAGRHPLIVQPATVPSSLHIQKLHPSAAGNVFPGVHLFSIPTIIIILEL